MSGPMQGLVVAGALTLAANATIGDDVAPAADGNTLGSALLQFGRIYGKLGRGYLAGLGLSNAADADHDITVAAGEARDSANGHDLVLAAAITKQIDATWAAGNAAGGLFTGSVANSTWYHVFLIRKDSDGSIDAGFDTSITAANIPTGYTAYRRLGSVLTDGSANILAFTQYGDTTYWTAPITDHSNGTGGTIAVSVPPSITPEWIGEVEYRLEGSDSSYIDSVLAQPVAQDPVQGAQVWVDSSVEQDFSGRLRIPFRTHANASSQIKVKAGIAAGVYVYTDGYVDRRGRDD